MKLEDFVILADLVNKREIEKIEYIAFYFLENKKQTEFTISEMAEILVYLQFARPNTSRLKNTILKSSNFNKGIKKDNYRLSAKRIKILNEEYPNLSESENIISDNSILPETLLRDTKRPYLIKLAKQINAAYENNLLDACALMMRRLLEVLLIHCFEEKKIDSKVKDSDGNYQKLKTLIDKAITFPEIQLSADAIKDIDTFRELGNLSAHRVKYNCRKTDIKKVKMKFRAIIEELLYISNLLTK